MIPVVTAIVAALIAAVLAVYRERRLELANLLVAARVVSSALFRAAAVVTNSSKQQRATTELAPMLETMSGLTDAWKDHRNVLARHLSSEQWDAVDEATRAVAVVAALSQIYPDQRFSVHPTTDRTIDDLLIGVAVLNKYADTTGMWWNNPGRKSANVTVIRTTNARQREESSQLPSTAGPGEDSPGTESAGVADA